MPVIKTLDRANEFRITIEGRLAGDGVREVASLSNAALEDRLSRRITIDISLLTGYDPAGRKLLRELHIHGTNFAAATPASLVFLAEITAPRRRGVTVIPESVMESIRRESMRPEPMRPASETAARPLLMRAAAGGAGGRSS